MNNFPPSSDTTSTENLPFFAAPSSSQSQQYQQHRYLFTTATTSSSRPTTTSANPRKKRTKLMHIGDTNNNNNTVVFKPKYVKKPQQDINMHEDIPPCTECGKRFSSQKALYGHMRCHPERQWRGINPPPNFRRPVSPKGKRPDSEMTQEDHEVATYLLLLANGFGLSSENSAFCSNDHHRHVVEPIGIEGESAEAVAGTSSGFYGRFECSSCKKVFGSHQALGGHRASHKNVKGCFANARSDCMMTEVEEQNSNIGLSLWELDRSINVVGGNEGHRCDICLKVFSSGQALGGHKRCHWEKSEEAAAVPVNVNHPFVRNLDLNLPAPTATADQECSSSTSYNTSGLSLDLRLGL